MIDPGYTLRQYNDDLERCLARVAELRPILTYFITKNRETFDYSLLQPVFIKPALENTSEKTLRLILRMFLTNHLNLKQIILDKRKQITKKKVVLTVKETEPGVLLPNLVLMEKRCDGWHEVKDYQELDVEDKYIRKVPMIMKNLFK